MKALCRGALGMRGSLCAQGRRRVLSPDDPVTIRRADMEVRPLSPDPATRQHQLRAALDILSEAEVEAMKCAQIARGPAPPPRSVGVSLALDEALVRVKVRVPPSEAVRGHAPP